MKPRLVRDRVTLASVAVLAAGLAALSIATNVVLSDRLSADASALLRERSGAQLATIDARSGHVRIREANDQALDRQSWAYEGGRAIERPPGAQRLQRVADSLAGVTTATERNLGESTRLRATPIRSPAGRRIGTVVVGISLAPYEHSERIARIATIALDLLVLLLGALVARRAVRAALRPVADMASSAVAWSEHDLHRRFELGPAGDELTALAGTLDDLLARIDAARRHEQRFSAEMAHELRTPLSGVRAEAELALRGRGLTAATRASLEAILAASDRMASAIETLLLTARAPVAPGWSDPAIAVRDAADALRPAAAAAGVELELRDPATSLRVGAEPELVARALAPLLDNAISHASSRVVVSLGACEGRIAITVHDDGPGLAEHQQDTIFEPGVSTRAGAGLGLPLARRLARSCGGDVVALPGRPGGHFELVLPGAPAAVPRP